MEQRGLRIDYVDDRPHSQIIFHALDAQALFGLFDDLLPRCHPFAVGPLIQKRRLDFLSNLRLDPAHMVPIASEIGAQAVCSEHRYGRPVACPVNVDSRSLRLQPGFACLVIGAIVQGCGQQPVGIIIDRFKWAA